MDIWPCLWHWPPSTAEIKDFSRTRSHWPREDTLGGEAQARHLWDSYGPPWFWKVLDGKCNLQHCVLKAQAPWLEPKLKFLVVQPAGIETILNTRKLPMASRRAIFKNNKQWELISLAGEIGNVNGYAHLHGILSSPNPGLFYPPQQITICGIWERDVFAGKG